MKSPVLSAAIVAGSFLAASVAWAQAPAVPAAPAASGQGEAAPAAGAMDHAKDMMEKHKGMMEHHKGMMDHGKMGAQDSMEKMAPAEKK